MGKWFPASPRGSVPLLPETSEFQVPPRSPHPRQRLAGPEEGERAWGPAVRQGQGDAPAGPCSAQRAPACAAPSEAWGGRCPAGGAPRPPRPGRQLGAGRGRATRAAAVPTTGSALPQAAPRAPPGPASTTGPARTASAATPAAAPRATRAGTARWVSPRRGRPPQPPRPTRPLAPPPRPCPGSAPARAPPHPGLPTSPRLGAPPPPAPPHPGSAPLRPRPHRGLHTNPQGSAPHPPMLRAQPDQPRPRGGRTAAAPRAWAQTRTRRFCASPAALRADTRPRLGRCPWAREETVSCQQLPGRSARNPLDASGRAEAVPRGRMRSHPSSGRLERRTRHPAGSPNLTRARARF